MTDEQHNHQAPLVGICMGSESDLPVMREAADALTQLEVAYEVRILSAHRTPAEMTAYAEGAQARGLRVLIAGAGGAAHLPGMIAASTVLPVLGVPVPSRHLQGLDSLLSIVQMPGGVPVGTLAIGQAKNAGLLAARMLATTDDALRARLETYHREMHAMVRATDDRVHGEFSGT
ncbi:MAG: 5-(carboxyamino)imidazole ribonucleotide mutase [Nannocystaceae bacterium]